MELKKKRGRFITDFYGRAPALGAEGILTKWIDNKQNEWLLSWADKVKKKGQTAKNALEEILSVFHRDEEGKPIIGNWISVLRKRRRKRPMKNWPVFRKIIMKIKATFGKISNQRFPGQCLFLV